MRTCDWWIKEEKRRCPHPARWLFEPRLDRAVCDHHAASWRRRGQTFAKLQGFATAVR